jgi:hypothetical protein
MAWDFLVLGQRLGLFEIYILKNHFVFPPSCIVRVLRVHIPAKGLLFNFGPGVFNQESELTIVYKQQSNRLIYVNFLISSLDQVGSKASFN